MGCECRAFDEGCGIVEADLDAVDVGFGVVREFVGGRCAGCWDGGLGGGCCCYEGLVGYKEGEKAENAQCDHDCDNLGGYWAKKRSEGQADNKTDAGTKNTNINIRRLWWEVTIVNMYFPLSSTSVPWWPWRLWL